MPHTPTPWLGLAAVIAMFVLPFLPEWLFEGRRTIKHYPRRHVCGYCNAPWTEGHDCVSSIEETGPPDADALLRGDLRRLGPAELAAPQPERTSALERRPRVRIGR